MEGSLKKRNRSGSVLRTIIPINSESAGSTVNGLAHGPENKELEKLLECPVCQNIPLPPIYSCQTGHFICYPCKLLVKNGCPICNETYTETRNYPLESIVQTSTFHCNHRHHGCTAELSAREFTEHHKICPHRPMKCFLSDLNDCDGPLLYVADYVEHLKSVHELPTYNGSDWKANVFKINHVDNAWGVSDENHLRSWPSSLFNFNGRFFATQVFSQGPFFYIGLTIIAEKDEAAKYAVSITIQKNEKSVPKYELTTTVPSIRYMHEKQPIEDLPFAAVDKDLLERLGQVIFPVQDDEDISEAEGPSFRWNIRYEIKTLQNNSCIVM